MTLVSDRTTAGSNLSHASPGEPSKRPQMTSRISALIGRSADQSPSSVINIKPSFTTVKTAQRHVIAQLQRGMACDDFDPHMFAVLAIKENHNGAPGLEIRTVPEAYPEANTAPRPPPVAVAVQPPTPQSRRSVATTCTPGAASPVSDLDVEDVLAALTAAAALSSPISSARTSASDLSNVEPFVEPLIGSEDVCYSTPHPSLRLPTPRELASCSASSYDGHMGLVRRPGSDFELFCMRSGCTKRVSLAVGRKQFKSCHSCFTYYCSRRCRAADWPHHKSSACVYSETGSVCKRAIRHVLGDLNALYHLSRVARTGYLSLGRGALVMLFRKMEEARLFLSQPHAIEKLPQQPIYVSVRDLEASGHLNEPCLESIASATRYYNPETHFVLNVAVAVPSPLSQSQARPRRTTRMIKKCATLALSNAQLRPRSNRNDGPVPLILTSQVEAEGSSKEEAKRQRQVSPLLAKVPFKGNKAHLFLY